MPPTIPGELADAAVALIESPTGQAAITTVVTAGEANLESLLDSLISNAKAGGALAIVLNALKGTAEADVNAEFAKLSAPVIVAWLTSEAVAEAKALGG